VLGADKGTVRIVIRGLCEKEAQVYYYYCPSATMQDLLTNCENSACGKLFTLKQQHAGKNSFI
jgi:hypothetical protein